MRNFFSKTKWGIFHPGPVLPPSGEDSPFLTSVELFDGTLRAADESFPTSSDWAPFWRRSQSPETFLICFKFDSKFCYREVSRSPRLRGSFDAECLFEKSPEQTTESPEHVNTETLFSRLLPPSVRDPKQRNEISELSRRRPEFSQRHRSRPSQFPGLRATWKFFQRMNKK